MTNIEPALSLIQTREPETATVLDIHGKRVEIEHGAVYQVSLNGELIGEIASVLTEIEVASTLVHFVQWNATSSDPARGSVHNIATATDAAVELVRLSCITSFSVHAPNGLFIQTPNRASADEFAGRFGGEVTGS